MPKALSRLRLPLLFLALLLPFLPPMDASAQPDKQNSAVVVMYHRFGEDETPSTNIRIDQFKEHLRILGEEHRVVFLAQVVTALRDGAPLPANAVAVTIDDAYASVYEQGWPLLRAAGIPFTLFVATEPVGHPGYMTWDQIRELRDAGVTLGLHSHAHGHLPQMTPEAQRADLALALDIFQRELGQRPSLFAYPFGEADRAAQTLVREMGFAAAFGQHSGVAAPGESLDYLPRFALNEHYGEPERLRRVLGALPIPATEIEADPAPDANPPVFGYTVTDDSLDLGRLACYGPDGAAAPTQITGRRVEVRLPEALPKGRARINCTLPGSPATGSEGRWHWRGTQFTLR